MMVSGVKKRCNKIRILALKYIDKLLVDPCRGKANAGLGIFHAIPHRTPALLPAAVELVSSSS